MHTHTYMYSHCTVIHSHKLLGLDGSEYGMVGNYRGVLIFVIFVVDLAVTKFSHPRKLMPTVICKSMVMGVAINIVIARPTLPSILASNIFI